MSPPVALRANLGQVGRLPVVQQLDNFAIEFLIDTGALLGVAHFERFWQDSGALNQLQHQRRHHLDVSISIVGQLVRPQVALRVRKSINRRKDARDDVPLVVLVLFFLEDGRQQVEADKLERFDVVHEEDSDAVVHARAHQLFLEHFLHDRHDQPFDIPQLRLAEQTASS